MLNSVVVCLRNTIWRGWLCTTFNFEAVQIDHFEYQQSQNEEQGKFREGKLKLKRHIHTSSYLTTHRVSRPPAACCWDVSYSTGNETINGWTRTATTTSVCILPLQLPNWPWQAVSHAIRLLEPARKVPIFVPQSTDGTCHWIFEHQSFKDWLDSGCRQVLWIKGSQARL